MKIFNLNIFGSFYNRVCFSTNSQYMETQYVDYTRGYLGYYCENKENLDFGYKI